MSLPPPPKPPGAAFGSMRTVRCGVDERLLFDFSFRLLERRPRIWETGRFAPPAPTNESGRPEVSTNESVCPEVSTNKSVAYARQWPPMRALGTPPQCCLPAYCLRLRLCLCFVCTPVLLFFFLLFLFLLRRSDDGSASARGCNAAAAEIALPGLSSVSSYRSCCCSCCAQQPSPQKKTAAATTTTAAELRRAARFCGASIRR